MGSRKYEIQTYSICGGWENNWSDSETDKSVVFKSKREAKEELKTFFEEEEEAFKKGFIESTTNRDDFRIVRTDNAKD